MTKTCLLGLGRTGKVVAEELIKSPQFDLVSVVGKPGSSRVGTSLNKYLQCEQEITLADSDDLEAEIAAKQFKVAIDFTSPAATLKNAHILAKHGIHLVIGTTGFNNMQLYELKDLVHQYRIGLVYAPNLSVGINLLLSVVKTITRLIPHYDVEITESCHRNKKDSPSGTALKIANEVNSIKQTAKGNKLSFGRKGTTERDPDEIGIHSIRAGGIVGVHQVLFAGDADEIEITHRSYSRAIFAEGALKAAAFIKDMKGFFHMEDVLLNEKMDRDLRLAANRMYLKYNYK